MNHPSNTIIIRPSFIRLLVYLVAIQLPVYLFVYAALHDCNQAYECVEGAIRNDWLIFLFLVIVSVLSSRRLFVIEIGGENSIAPNVLKGPGHKRIDLSKQYSLNSERGSLKLAQGKSKISVHKFFYSRADVEMFLLLVKI